MARADNTYSRIVAGMKILLPLVALGLLSTLFLISNTVDPSGPVPTAPIDLEQRAQNLGVTRPSFAGISGRGDEIKMRADVAWPDPDDTRRLIAERITGEIGLIGGTVLNLSAANARLDQTKMTAMLEGAVHITSTAGYEIDTDRLDTRLDALYAKSPGPVTATGPLGDLDAGHMILREAPGSGDAELVFSGGVKLVYRPNIEKEQDQ
ncbi:LPS export ABC transporter periplasmic protein LptC [Roseovarius nitratireducens]|uniref:LPS export ABC transporter periplasmic protein LptC n=1 Tax=Roseovarius nitratireducens TaxID=2044597 RepID=UPI000CE21869|nr:LPS export ABC transporter periplasmic protein LptC [Roseovarius nitratireducens]